jgi:hypothetical protein
MTTMHDERLRECGEQAARAGLESRRLGTNLAANLGSGVGWWHPAFRAGFESVLVAEVFERERALRLERNDAVEAAVEAVSHAVGFDLDRMIQLVDQAIDNAEPCLVCGEPVPTGARCPACHAPPACGHSACRQHWIDSGSPSCVEEER